MCLFFRCEVWTMISYYSSLLLTICTSLEVYKPRLEMILNDMVYWSTNVVYWHKPSPLSPIQTEFLTSVLSLLSLDVILSGLFFLLYWEYFLRCSYRDIPIYLLWNTILCTNLYWYWRIVLRLISSCNDAPCNGGQVLWTKPAPTKVAIFRQVL